jgi:hypothetical protein
MPREYILGLICRMQVRPTPLFRNDIDSADSADSHDGNNAAIVANVDEMMATQGPEDSGEAEAMPTQGAEALGENRDLVPSIGLLD